jgi:acyl-CoA synthetase (NDP forming)
MTKRDLKSPTGALAGAFDANHIALFGASATPGKWGHTAAARLVEANYRGKLTLVNPKGGEMLGRPLVAPAEAAGADLAVITTAATSVPGIVGQCGELGIPVAVVQAGGFAEVGNAELEAQLRSSIDDSGVRVIGPNCVGLFVGPRAINTTQFPNVPVGSVSLVSQSGALADHLGRRLEQLGSGFDVLVSLGNKVDVNVTEVVNLIIDRPSSSALVLYLERLDEGEQLLNVLDAASKIIPVVAIVAGRTVAGRTAARSHTGSMVTNWDRITGLLASVGVQVVDDLPSAAAAAVGGRRSARRSIANVFVLSDGGGEAVLLADALEGAGYNLASPSPELARELSDLTNLPLTSCNPLDLQGRTDANPSLYGPLVRSALNDEQYDAIIVGGLFGAYADFWGESVGLAELRVAAELGKFQSVSHKLIVQSPYALEPSAALKYLRESSIPCLELASEIVHCLNSQKSSRSTQAVGVPTAHLPSPPPDEELVTLTARLTAVLEKAGIRHGLGDIIAREDLPISSDQRWVLRADGFAHKRAAGAIEVGVSTDHLAESFDRLCALARSAGLDPQVRLATLVIHRHEFIVSLWRHPLEGDGWLIGRGGSAVEECADVAIGRFPRNAADVISLLGQTRAGSLLLTLEPDAARALIEVSLRLAGLFKSDLPDVATVEFNPIALEGELAYVLDVLPVMGVTH